MNFHEIYNSLLTGKTLQIPFGSQKEAEGFRVKLARFKLMQERQMVEIGVLSASERQKFSFSLQGDLLDRNNPWVATLCFKDKEVSRQYEVKILPDTADPE